MKTSAFLTCLMAMAPAGWAYGDFAREPGLGRSWGMRFYSPAFPDNGYIPAKHTCDGENVSPAFHIRGVPEKARSLVLVVVDPDAMAGDWVHWTVWNMQAKTRVIPENNIPEGAVEGDTDFELPAWAGPCPRRGVHRYLFRLYSLDIRLDLSPRATHSELDEAMKGHILDRSELVGLYGRNPAMVAEENWIERKAAN